MTLREKNSERRSGALAARICLDAAKGALHAARNGLMGQADMDLCNRVQASIRYVSEQAEDVEVLIERLDEEMATLMGRHKAEVRQ